MQNAHLYHAKYRDIWKVTSLPILEPGKLCHLSLATQQGMRTSF